MNTIEFNGRRWSTVHLPAQGGWFLSTELISYLPQPWLTGPERGLEGPSEQESVVAAAVRNKYRQALIETTEAKWSHVRNLLAGAGGDVGRNTVVRLFTELQDLLTVVASDVLEIEHE